MTQRPNPVDGCFLRYEREHHGVRPYIGVVLHATGSAPKLSVVRQQVADRIERMPTLSCKVTKQGRRTVWATDAAFDPYDHVHEFRLPAGSATLDTTVAALLAVPLPEDAPRWGIWLIHGYADHEYVLFYRAHHAAQDGQALLDAVTALFGTGPPLAPRPAVTARAVRRPWRQKIPARAVARSLADAVRGPALSWPTQDTLTGEPRLASAAVPVSWLRETGRALGASANDVCLAALAHALRAWVPAGWIAADQRGRDLQVSLPVSLREPQERFAVGNRLSAVRIPLSFWEDSPTARVAAIARATGRARAADTRRVLQAQLRLPESAVYRFLRQGRRMRNGLDTSGLLQLHGRLALGADPIETAVATLFLHGDHPFAVSFLGYAGQVVVCFTIDRGFEDVGNLAALWASAVERLWHQNVAKSTAAQGSQP
ncbi:wax ester/triacylglycerol synthase domain-containing protein [Kitasatospora sp. GAS1066B]|uniref:wax ester/triacylglycerol synthase domain-containing protein n=1 Tax=Kitasatospora sp. GAS1066B TaxID=3156271 RepID=UPI003514BA53